MRTMHARTSALAGAMAAALLTLACGAPRNADGAFEGTVARVWEDGLRLDADGGGSVRIDTWDVCGDNTARNLSVGDRVVVYADRDLLGFDASRILKSGQPAC